MHKALVYTVSQFQIYVIKEFHWNSIINIYSVTTGSQFELIW